MAAENVDVRKRILATRRSACARPDASSERLA